MWRHTTAWLLVVTVLGVTLFAGCGKSKKSEETPPQGQMPDAYYQQSGAYGQQPRQMPGAYGQQYGALGQQQMQAAPAQPTELAEVAPAGPPYQERYEQGDLTAEELRKEHELQEVERQLGYPVGP